MSKLKLLTTKKIEAHIWSHAWKFYESLAADRQTGRFKQLTKLLPKGYEPSKGAKKEQKKLFYEKYPQPSNQQSTPSSERVLKFVFSLLQVS